MPTTQLKDSREVNTLLHTLRGEQFRHLQNVKHCRTRFATLQNYNAPTLPISLGRPDRDPDLLCATPATTSRSSSVAGPPPPKSWRPVPATDSRETAAWRLQALSLVVSHLGNFPDPFEVPSLSLLCLQVILSNCTNSSEFREDVVPYIPAHLRRDLIRFCAVHSPLPIWKLDALFDPHGHADGEIFVVGPTTQLRDDHFLLVTRSKPRDTSVIQDDCDWESDDHSTNLLNSLILISTRLATSTLLSIPPTLSILVLINLPSPIPLHRLPKICPLLALLDLSYNSWLKESAGDPYSNSLERVEWTRWSHLKVLGLRECYISDELIQKINKGRWDDVEVVR